MPIIVIEQGKLLGTVSKDIDGKDFYSFKGIPYAKPPLGTLRFKAPLPPVPWEGTFDATKEGNCCYSAHLFTKKMIGSEDCLNLNVYTPMLPSPNQQLLPVMVWIHGGGFLCGSNSTEFYGPEFLMTSKVLLVTVNYRLGLLGFLGIGDPKIGIPGNAGFKDMIMALQWVQKNISRFNGNPGNVTIFGESAGGVAVHLLMLSPMSKDLFHKAIAQSGCALNPWSRAKKCDEEMYKILDCEGKSGEEFVQYMQSLPVEKLLQKQALIPYFIVPDKLYPYGLVIERREEEQDEPPFMCEDPVDIILSRRIMDVPFIIGYVKNEGLLVNTYRPKRVDKMISDFEATVPHLLGYETGSTESRFLGLAIKELYYGNEQPSDNNRYKLYDMFTDIQFLYGIYASVRLHVSKSVSPVYFYRMSLQTSLKFLQVLATIDKHLGPAHGDDVPYLFKNIFTPQLRTDSLEYFYIKRMVQIWTNFATCGNPTPDKFPVSWERVNKEQIYLVDIDKELKLVRLEENNLGFWDRVYSGSPSGSKFVERISKL